MNNPWIIYVLGFAFDGLGQVALVKKNRPEWQKGKLNGIGGKVEPGETRAYAMAREFREETGLTILPEEWSLRGHIVDYKQTILVAVYSVFHPKISTVRPATDELIALYNPQHLIPSRCIENVPALIELCKMGVSDKHGTVASFTLTY